MSLSGLNYAGNQES